MKPGENEEMREHTQTLRALGMTGRGIASGRNADKDARRLMDEIPRDTRSLTGRLFGDPLPGRRAIDQR